MSMPMPAENAFLIIGLMRKKEESAQEIKELLSQAFGKIREESGIYEFSFTSFYDKEFGKGTVKEYLIFSEEFDIEKLADAKHMCYSIEEQYKKEGKRRFNIDPGYLTRDSVVLASFKKRPHRIYLKDGVYADLELVFENNSWKGFSWTFKDMKEPIVARILEETRKKLS